MPSELLEETLGPCLFCIEQQLYLHKKLTEDGDCDINPDEFQKCELIRKANGIKD
jgi:hypothetical protein